MSKFGLIGEKLGHSLSPSVHAMLGDYSYELSEAGPEEAKELLLYGDCDGFNVTMPHKRLAAKLCEELSDVAKRLGNVNTVLRRRAPDGSRQLLGFNTDYFGFRSLVCEAGPEGNPAGKKCLVLGSGAAGETAKAVLEDMGAASVVTVSRSGADNYGSMDRHADADILVNATPVGMYPDMDASPADLRLFSGLSAVFDLVYNPARTELVMQAQSMGIPAFGGLHMLAAQAAASSELFTGKKKGEAAARQICKSIDSLRLNVILIGMPGCGKSAVAAELAAITGRPLADTDEEIELRAGKSIEEIFASGSEEVFRDMESAVIEEAGAMSGAVIATGGGCVTRRANYTKLRRSGRVVWIKRPCELLETQGRPLSIMGDINKIYVNRKPLYESFADVVVENIGTPRSCALEIIELLGLSRAGRTL